MLASLKNAIVTPSNAVAIQIDVQIPIPPSL